MTVLHPHGDRVQSRPSDTQTRVAGTVMSGGSRLSDRLVKVVLDWMIRRRWYVPGSPFRRLIVKHYAHRDHRDRIWYFNTPKDITKTQVDAFRDWWERKA